MAEHLRKRREINIKYNLGRLMVAGLTLGGIYGGVVLTAGGIYGGYRLYRDATAYRSPSIAADNEPFNCKNALPDGFGEAEEPALALVQQEMIDNAVNANACKSAYAVAKQTVNFYISHKKLFPRASDSGGVLDLSLSDPKTHAIGEVDFATEPNGKPIYSELQWAMVGYQKGKLDWSVSIAPVPSTNSGKIGTEWDMSYQSSQPNTLIAPNFDSGAIPNNATAEQLQSIENQTLGLGSLMLRHNN